MPRSSNAAMSRAASRNPLAMLTTGGGTAPVMVALSGASGSAAGRSRTGSDLRPRPYGPSTGSTRRAPSWLLAAPTTAASIAAQTLSLNGASPRLRSSVAMVRLL